MSRPEDPDSRPTPRAPARGKTPSRAPAQKRSSKGTSPRAPAPAPLDSDFGVAMLVCCNDELSNDS